MPYFFQQSTLFPLINLNFKFSHDVEMSMKMINAGLSDCSDIFEPILLSIKAKLLVEIGKQDESILLIANACSRYKNLEKEHECDRWKEMRRKQQEQV